MALLRNIKKKTFHPSRALGNGRGCGINNSKMVQEPPKRFLNLASLVYQNLRKLYFIQPPLHWALIKLIFNLIGVCTLSLS